MKRVSLILFGVFVSAYALCQTAAKDSPAAVVSTWKTIEEIEYSIEYPESWELDRSGHMGMSFMLLSKQITPDDRFKENVNLLIQKLAGLNIDLDKFVAISEEQIKTLITNSNLLESKRLSKNGKTFHKVVYTGDQGVMKFKFEQYCWVQNEKAYIVTFTCEASQFDLYRETGEKILDSFQLK
jgi:hypothetical protein